MLCWGAKDASAPHRLLSLSSRCRRAGAVLGEVQEGVVRASVEACRPRFVRRDSAWE